MMMLPLRAKAIKDLTAWMDELLKAEQPQHAARLWWATWEAFVPPPAGRDELWACHPDAIDGLEAIGGRIDEAGGFKVKDTG